VLNTSLEISSLSQSKNKRLLSSITAFRLYCQSAPIHTYYKLTQFTYMNFNTCAGQWVLICRRHWLIHRAILPCRLVHINCIHWFPVLMTAFQQAVCPSTLSLATITMKRVRRQSTLMARPGSTNVFKQPLG